MFIVLRIIVLQESSMRSGSSLARLSAKMLAALQALMILVDQHA